MPKNNLALLAAFTATTIYALNHTIAKVVMPKFIEPLGFVQLRIIGAAILFWIVSFFITKDKIKINDFKKIFLATCIGMFINMIAYIKGLSLTTPINAGLISTLTPLFVLILSYIFLKESITTKKIMGISLGFFGAIILVIMGDNYTKNAPNPFFGNILLLINCLCYGSFLIVIKNLLAKYHFVNLVKWMFTIGIFLNLPFGYDQLMSVEWKKIPFDGFWRISFVVIGTTFFTYLLNIYALKRLTPTKVVIFAYMQPIIAIIYAVLSENDKLDLVKVISCIVILSGVYLVTQKTR